MNRSFSRPIALLLALGALPLVTGASGNGCGNDVSIGNDGGGGPAPVCSSSSDCAQIESCALCGDGTSSCPSAECVDGQCVTAWPDCPPSQCVVAEDCPGIGAPCELCPDGVTTACPSVDCVEGQCVGSFPGCPGWTPCADLPCGAPCSLCDPTDPNCAAPAVETFCDPNGTCQIGFPVCTTPVECTSDLDCPQFEGCAACPGGGDACPETACIDGVCVTSWPGCPGYEPCAGKLCGESCTVCDPNDPTCAETDVLKFCDELGACVVNFPVCGGATCNSDAECPAVGAPCEPCPGGGASCPESLCLDGQCQIVWSTCGGYDACAGKACGETCSLCDPNDPTCVGPDVLMFCDGGGNCQMNMPICF